ncbi:hypothetical protein D3C81_566370 [compost metagenome]
MRAHRGRAGKGNLGDTLAGGQGFTGFAAKAVDDVEHASGQQITDQFSKHGNRQRRLLGRLEHHAVARGQGRGEFPGGHQQREVPGDDLPDHAERLMEVISGGVLVDLGGTAFLGADAAGEVTKVIGSQWHVGIQGFADGLAVVPGFTQGQHFKVLFDAIGDLQQDSRALLHGRAPPGIGYAMGGIQRQVDVGRAGARELGNRLAIDRRAVAEVLACQRGHEFAADVVAVNGLEADQGISCARGCVDHGGLMCAAGLSA